MLTVRYLITCYYFSYICILSIPFNVFLFYLLVSLVHITGMGGTAAGGRLVFVRVYVFV